ncbi:MAG: UDP-N-acetylmuramoyl-tripeptide--D-alanyl-D-alanine ligase [Candidatus Omnitrophota bacterium]
MFNVKELVQATGGIAKSSAGRGRFSGIATDTRMLGTGDVFVALIGKRFDGHDFIPEAISAGAKAIVFSDARKVGSFQEGVVYIQVPETTQALGAIARFHRRRFDIPIIAVTGSSGKTTTKEMLAWVLGAKYHVLKNEGTQNNLIGVPLTLLKIHSKHDLCVVELGTNRVGEIRQLSQIAEPNMGIITNIGPAHLEFLGSLKGVYREKIDCIKHLKAPMIALLNKGDMLLEKLSRIRSQPFFFFGINTDADFKATEIIYKHQSIVFLFNGVHEIEVKHCALHNVSNALAAIGCGLLFGLDFEEIKAKIESFDSPAMRLKELNLKTCTVFDDSYNSNPQSLKQAIDVLCRRETTGRRILIMGDMKELGKKSEEFHSYFGRYVAKKPIQIFVTMGDFSHAAAEQAKKNGLAQESVFHFDSHPQVIEFLDATVAEGDVLLVKGSRSMQMEKIVTHLKEHY